MTTQAESAYRELVDHLREQALVASCQELLSWDELTRLPRASTEYRAGQISYLAGKHHELATDPRLGAWLDLLEHSVEPSSLISKAPSDVVVNIREARRQYDRLIRLPRGHVEELARLITAAQHQWQLAREADDFRLFQPWLEKIVLRKREEALCLNFGGVPYDALLDEFEPGITTVELNARFGSLASELAGLLPEILAWQARSKHPCPTEVLHREFEPAAQRTMCQRLALDVGFDFARGALDSSVHPFTSLLGPADCRIALRFDRHNLCEGLFGALHEFGHALYDQGLPHEHFGTPLGEAASLSIHESQGRFWECAVGRSLGFWQYLRPRLAEQFPAVIGDASPAQLWRAVNFVEPGLNRVRADEVTYNLHILIRFKLEQALLSGDLPVADLPGAWNEWYQQHLGLTPARPRDGCLQDGHWASALFGYFPTYTLGNFIAAQLAAQAEKDLGPLTDRFAQADFTVLGDWMTANVYALGKRFSTADLVERVTGQPLDHRAFIDGLRSRHQQLWCA